MYSQDYLDVFRISQNNTSLGNVDDGRETDVSNFQAELLLPFPISSKTSIVGGFTYENTRLALNFVGDRTNLSMARLNVGIKQDLGNKWNVTAVALPKLATDFDNVGSDDFQMGGIALFEKRYNSKKSLKFGGYVSSENFGTTITPLIGAWYKSSNKKFTVDAVLPIRAQVNYHLSDAWRVGANLLTSIKSYNLAELNSDFYVQEESIRFALTTSYGFEDDTFILRGKVGLDTTDYGLYEQGDVIGAQILTFQVSGDDRNRLNSEFDSSLYFGIDFIYRLPL
jgi:hypothetical protein